MAFDMPIQIDGVNIDDIADDEDRVQETRTYRIDFENGCIQGMIDEKEAVEQFIRKVLLTQRYAYLIYNVSGDNYGCEVQENLGATNVSDKFLDSNIPVVIGDALTSDSRILDIDEVNYSRNTDDSAAVSIVVNTIYGKVSVEEVI